MVLSVHACVGMPGNKAIVVWDVHILHLVSDNSEVPGYCYNYGPLHYISSRANLLNDTLPPNEAVKLIIKCAPLLDTSTQNINFDECVIYYELI